MFGLAHLIVQQRWRRLTLQNRWPVIATVGGLLVLFALRIGYVTPLVAARLTHHDGLRVIASLWIGWTLLGCMSGKDLTAHLPLQRLTILPISFRKLYALDLLLAWLSAPMLALVAGVTTAAVRLHADVAGAAAVILSAIAFVYGVRLTVSILRSLLMSSEVAPSWRIAIGVVVIAAAAAAWQVEHVRWIAAAFIVALIAIDYPVQQRVLLSGTAGQRPFSPSRRQRWLRISDDPRTVLFLLTLISWLRNRNALLLLLWGTSYGFLYTYFTRPQEQSYFLLFTFMVLMFHSYLRGNVLGLDHRAAWAYFSFPGAASRVVALKQASLTLLQLVMVAAVLASAIIHQSRGMSTAAQWLMVISYALSAIAVSELAGTFLSILHAEPIERGSMYSGGTTVGAFVVPILLFALLLFYGGVITTLRSSTGQLAFATLLPLLFWIARVFAARTWMRMALRREKEQLLVKLSSVSV